MKAVCLKCRTHLIAKTNGVIVEMGNALWKADLLQRPKFRDRLEVSTREA